MWTPVAIVRKYFAACEARDLAGARALFAPDFSSATATAMSVDYARIVIHTIRDGMIIESAGVSDSLALAEAKAGIATRSQGASCP